MESEKKNQTGLLQKNIEPIAFFENDANFVFVYKKTEKLASAIYMVTSLFSDSEPMKWTLRKKSSELLSYMLSYKDVSEAELKDFIYNSKTKILEVVSFLEISVRGGIVSNMNFSIIKNEFSNLSELFSNSLSSIKDHSHDDLTKDFFEIHSDGSSLVNMKSQQDHVALGPRMSHSVIKDINSSSVGIDIKRSNRQNVILNLLKKKKDLTIKDIAEVIKDCSEKTIQRELISFISSGIIKRTGERRWSRYSLV